MKKWLKRIRGAVGMGLTWAVAWFGASVIFALAFPGISGVVTTFTSLGFIAGAAFSVVLGSAGRRRRFDEMSLPRFAGWGAVGGLLTSGLAVGISGVGSSPLLPVMIFVSIVTLLAAGSAGGSLALARKAEDRELLDDGGDVADIGLTEEEKVELLGR